MLRREYIWLLLLNFIGVNKMKGETKKDFNAPLVLTTGNN